MRGLSAEALKSLILSVGTHRRDRPLSPVEVAEVYQRALAGGASLEDVARASQFDGTTMVSRFLRLLKLSPEVRHLVDWGQGSNSTIGFSAGSQLSRLEAGADQVRACHAALEHSLTSKEVEQAVQLRLRSHRPIEECIREIVDMRPRIERRHLLIGAITSNAVRCMLATITQAERDKLLRAVLAEKYPESACFAGRLGVERFTVTGDESMAPLAREPEAVEALVNSGLAQKLGNP